MCNLRDICKKLSLKCLKRLKAPNLHHNQNCMTTIIEVAVERRKPQGRPRNLYIKIKILKRQN